MKNLLAAIVVFLSCSSLLTQEYFIYNYSEKMVMNREYGYVTVKFRQNTPQSEMDKVYSSVSNYAKRKFEFTGTRENMQRSQVMIIELRKDMANDWAKTVELAVRSDKNVEYTGMCFRYNDKVLHFTSDEVIVKFKPNVSISEINNLNKLFKTRLVEKISTIDNTYLLSANPNSLDNIFDVSNKYSLTQFVEFAQPNFIRSGMLIGNENSFGENGLEINGDKDPKKKHKIHTSSENRLTTNDSLFPQMWHIKNTGSNVINNIPGIPGSDMNVEPAWDITTGNPNVMVAIIDTGIDTLHPDLIPNFCDRSLWYNAYDNNQYPFDDHYHGTGVSGTSSAVGNNLIGGVGTAFSSKVMPVKVFNSQTFTTDLILAKGISWAWQHGASVINCSWGGGIPTPLIIHAVKNATSYGRNGKGSVVFGGAGNGDTNIVIFPASMPEVIGVGGLSPCNQRKSKLSCDFTTNNDSNYYWGACYGEGLDVVAPCVMIGTTTRGGGACICGNGTSVSSPLAAGIGALMISKNGNISGDSVRSIIRRTAVKTGNYSYNIQKEYGMWNNEMGYGRLDAKACLDAVPQGTEQLYEQVPPIIKLYPPESKIYSSMIEVQADIADLSGIASGNNSPKLYYRTMQSTQMQMINGNNIGNGRYTFTFPMIQQSQGLYYYIAAQDNIPVPNFMTYPIGGSGVNPPGGSNPPRLLFVRNTPVYDTAFESVDVPVIIPEQSESTVFSVLNNQTSKLILDVNCTVNITHTFDADMTISLISPQGTEIILAGGVGWDGDNFNNTIFDDEADLYIDSSLAQPPYSGTFKPLEKLWLLDGENSFGEWKLKIVDNGYADGGQLLAWSLKFKYSDGTDNVIIPGNFSLVKNYPNPFNPSTRIVFNVPKLSRIKIVVYDVAGKEVKTVLDETRSPALEDFVDFDASSLASGVYFYSMIADGEFIDSKRMVFVK